MFSKSNIPFVEEQYDNDVFITVAVQEDFEEDNSKVQGYSGFYSSYVFDNNGNFKYICIGE